MLDTNTLAVAGLGLGVLIAGVFNGWQSVQANRNARHARTHAECANEQATKAADNSKPVSNGFTAEVRKSLADIFLMATEARDMATSANSHAEAASNKVDRHLEAHANGQALQLVRDARL